MTEVKRLWRPNVGIVLTDGHKRVLWAKRADKDAWQFPQGGINPGETTVAAMYRELQEELGLHPHDVEILAESLYWRKYNFVSPMPAEDGRDYVGQEQKWFLLKLVSNESAIDLDHCPDPEFTAWRWVDYWIPKEEIVDFKKPVYVEMLEEFSKLVGIEL